MRYKTCTEYWLDTETYTFRGEFEEMYRDIEDPWGCHKNTLSLHNRLFLEILFDGRKYNSILDIGCGLGGLTDCIYKRNGGQIIGCDISKTAIEKACSLYPHITFSCLDIIRDGMKKLGEFDLVIISEILWYILDGLDKAFSNIYDVLAPSGICGVRQYFPFEQRFGKDVVEGLDGFEQFIGGKTRFVMEQKVLVFKEDGIVLLARLRRE